MPIDVAVVVGFVVVTVAGTVDGHVTTRRTTTPMRTMMTIDEPLRHRLMTLGQQQHPGHPVVPLFHCMVVYPVVKSCYASIMHRPANGKEKKQTGNSKLTL